MWVEDKEEGEVRRFDKQGYSWVVLTIENIPDDVIEERRE